MPTVFHLLPAVLSRMAVLAALTFAGLAGSALPASAQIFGGDNGEAQKRQAEMSLRIGQLEGQLRQMNGQVEQLGFQVKQLNDLIARMQKDYEFRLQELENGGARKPAAAPVKKSEAPMVPMPQQMAAGAQPAYDEAPQPQRGIAAPPAAVARSGPGAPPQVLGQISSKDPIGGVIGGAGAPLDLAPSGARSQVVINQTGDDDDPDDAPPGVNLGPVPARAPVARMQAAPAPVAQAPQGAGDTYDVAYTHILNGEYAQAETSFKTFLQENPTDRRAASSQYWLGETYFSRKMYREAADAFLTSYQQYPQSQKAPDSLLKLGLSLGGLGEKKAACASFDELLAKYPKASKALRDLAAAEKNRAKCA